MSVLFGLVSARQQDFSEPLQAASLRAAQFGRDGQYSWQSAPVLLGRAVNRVRERARPELRLPLPLQDLQAVASARIDNRSLLLATLQLDPQCSDTELIIHAYQRWGMTCVEHLAGDYAFVLWDAARQRLFCARDRIGVRPLHYRYQNGQLAVASTLPVLNALDAAGCELDPLTWLAHFARLPGEGGASFWQGCQRLPPGCALSFDFASQRLQVWRYWQPVAQAFSYRSPAQWAEAATESLAQALAARTAEQPISGLQLSGGLDSSLLLALLVENRGAGSVRTVSSVLPPQLATQGVDERSQQRLLLQHFSGLDHSEVWDDDDQPLSLETWRPLWQGLGRPANLFYPKDHQLCANLSNRACRVVVTGFWGDGTLSYRGGNWLAAAAQSHGLAAAWRLLRAVAAREARAPYRVLASELLGVYRGRRMQRKPRVISAFLWQAYCAAVPARSGGPDLPSPHPLGHTLRNGFHCLEEFALAAASHGQELAFPFLDADFCTLIMSAPLSVHVGDGWRRYLARLALQSRVPAPIWQRQDKQAYAPGACQYFAQQQAKYITTIASYGRSEAVAPWLGRYFDLRELRAYATDAPLQTASLLLALEYLVQSREIKF